MDGLLNVRLRFHLVLLHVVTYFVEDLLFHKFSEDGIHIRPTPRKHLVFTQVKNFVVPLF
jgi:hypothetical protein